MQTMTLNQKLSIFATRMNQKVIQHKLKTTERGHQLLQSKSDALQAHFRQIESQFNSLNLEIEKIFKQAFLSLSKAEFLGANVELFKKNSCKFPIQLSTEIQIVSGIQLPVFRIITKEPIEEFLERGGSQLVESRKLFRELAFLLIDVCSVKNSFFILKSTLDITNRRVNSLEHLMIPRLQNTLQFISAELDEQEREDFFRLKKIQSINNKKNFQYPKEYFHLLKIYNRNATLKYC